MKRLLYPNWIPKQERRMNLPEMFTSLLTPRLDFIVIHLEGFSYFIYIYIYIYIYTDLQICNLLPNYNQCKESKFDPYWV